MPKIRQDVKARAWASMCTIQPEGKGENGRSTEDLRPVRQRVTYDKTASIPAAILALGFWKIPLHISDKSPVFADASSNELLVVRPGLLTAAK